MKVKTKNILIMAGLLLLGFLLGWLFFGGDRDAASAHDHTAESGVEEVWTCSMHPQIRQNEPGKCPLCGMDLIPLEGDASEGDPAVVAMSENAVKLANIRTMTVGRQVTEKKLRLNGKVVPDERKVYAQTTHVPGRIEKLSINFTGEKVRRGQTLAVVYSPELVTAQEELLQAHAIRNAQPELFEAAKQKLRNWKIGEAQMDNILENQSPLQRFPIGADVNGIVTERKVEPGDYVERGMPLYEIADLSAMWVLFDIYESEMTWVKEGSTIKYTIASLPGETFEGEVTFVDPLINAQTRVATARVEVSNKDGRLKPEMFASGEMHIAPEAASDKTITIPESAVLWTGERSVVYTRETGGGTPSFKMREVVLGPSLGEAYVVKKGLEEGDEIVINGTFTVDAAAQLAGKPSMMSPDGGDSGAGHHHGGGTPASGNTGERKMPERAEISPEARHATEQVARAYLRLKDALAGGDAPAAGKAVGDISAALDGADMSLFKGTSHQYWMDFREEAATYLERMTGTGDLEEMRRSFKPLSESVIRMAHAFGPFSVTLYVQHCPMADSDNGADWLSLSREIRNPYFGDKMLKCGEITEEIK
ncbi:efflux RND transporter periplasmic adaptor subunit [Sinomicrobium soli]|uniref:efflux RND transporter periplasmic adaptor subunit n=1 Tax=Sinomicrobium sp. N-1-3-6 TaxID=2219864 RepID=UPI000DCB2AE8|nr:efflux RND transporter periplasmic adaptor subunit [Sinomicrobium sp. N-1-3-6]RAV30870.1 efflux RND transporter periplasmic adaptor subunit [Sinomicrobium sp. N-1-3-6]